MEQSEHKLCGRINPAFFNLLATNLGKGGISSDI
jgi:hypothetical protein